MTDEPKNTSPGDEYQFPQDEYITPTPEEGQAAPENDPQSGGEAASPTSESARAAWTKKLGMLSQFHNKRMIIIIGVVVGFILLIHFMSSSNTTPVAPQQAVSTPAPTPVVPQPVDNSASLGALSTLDSKSSEAESAIKALQTQITDMQGTVSQSQETNQQLQKTVDDLSAQVKALSIQLSKALSEAQSPNKPKGVTYHLRAVLPDRAWIMSSDGETVSVTLDDHIPGYGKVEQIDPQNGVVKTSTGRKITYGPNDF